ncbi:MAG: hypothetical protein IPM58_11675 [Nitrospira sp.]|nr:hypothetical protein [Nitrospira sp.]
MKRSASIWALLLCLVLVNGAMVAPSVSHAEHHADHQAGTHSTGLCAWLCAGGVGIESSVVYFTAHLHLLESLDSSPLETPFSVLSLPYFFRGPPSVLA